MHMSIKCCVSAVFEVVEEWEYKCCVAGCAWNRGVTVLCVAGCVWRRGVTVLCVAGCVSRMGVTVLCVAGCVWRWGVTVLCVAGCVWRSGVTVLCVAGCVWRSGVTVLCVAGCVSRRGVKVLCVAGWPECQLPAFHPKLPGHGVQVCQGLHQAWAPDAVPACGPVSPPRPPSHSRHHCRHLHHHHHQLLQCHASRHTGTCLAGRQPRGVRCRRTFPAGPQQPQLACGGDIWRREAAARAVPPPPSAPLGGESRFSAAQASLGSYHRVHPVIGDRRGTCRRVTRVITGVPASRHSHHSFVSLNIVIVLIIFVFTNGSCSIHFRVFVNYDVDVVDRSDTHVFGLRSQWGGGEGEEVHATPAAALAGDGGLPLQSLHPPLLPLRRSPGSTPGGPPTPSAQPCAHQKGAGRGCPGRGRGCGV